MGSCKDPSKRSKSSSHESEGDEWESKFSLVSTLNFDLQVWPCMAVDGVHMFA